MSGAVRGTVAIDWATGQLMAGTADCHVGTHKTKTSSISSSAEQWARDRCDCTQDG